MNTLRNHFIKSSTGGQPNYTIYYTADLQVPFIGGSQKRGLTMWETGRESEPLAAFKVVGDSFADGYGEWDIKTSNPSCFYGLIKDKNGYEYSMDSDNFHTITGLVFPEYDYDNNYITSIGGPLLGGGEDNSLTDVTLPVHLEYLGLDTFKGSVNLQTIIIPPYVETIGNNCFKECNSLTAFCCDALTPPVLNGLDIFGNFNTIPNLKIYVGFVEDYLQNEDWSKYADIIYLDPCVISYKATTRPSFNTSSVNPDYTYYTYHDYNNGRGLIRCSKEVTEINDHLFNINAAAISNIYLPNTITNIGQYAFDECSSLTSIVIPNSVTSIAGNAFTGCSSLTSVTINSNAIVKKDYSTGPYIYNIFGSQVTEYVIGDGVTSIGKMAFTSCPSLTSIIIPNSVTNIGEYAFYGCKSLTSIIIPNSVTSIGQYAFFGCSSLTTFVIPDGVPSIGNSAFFGCSSMTSITIPNSVTEIGERAFYNCSLTSITIPNSVKSIGESVFTYCYSLKSITIDSDAIMSKGYSSDSNLSHIFGSQVTTYIIGDSVNSIGDSAFSGCSALKEITIPNSVTEIGYSAFSGCSHLSKTFYTGDIAGWCNIKFSDEKANPLYYSVLFINNQRVSYLEIPNNINSINNYAFSHYNALNAVIFSNSVTSIGNYAFNSCLYLNFVTIPNSVTSIGEFAFEGCDRLTSITYDGTQEQWQLITFGNSWRSATLSVVHCTDGDVTL